MSNPLPRDDAVRQGDITHLAFQILGRDEAIAFLNTDNALLGGRPIALATESAAGQLHVEAELRRMRERQSRMKCKRHISYPCTNPMRHGRRTQATAS
jgi:hypothetical protein